MSERVARKEELTEDIKLCQMYIKGTNNKRIIKAYRNLIKILEIAKKED